MENPIRVVAGDGTWDTISRIIFGMRHGEVTLYATWGCDIVCDMGMWHRTRHGRADTAVWVKRPHRTGPASARFAVNPTS